MVHCHKRIRCSAKARSNECFPSYPAELLKPDCSLCELLRLAFALDERKGAFLTKSTSSGRKLFIRSRHTRTTVSPAADLFQLNESRHRVSCNWDLLVVRGNLKFEPFAMAAEWLSCPGSCWRREERGPTVLNWTQQELQRFGQVLSKTHTPEGLAPHSECCPSRRIEGLAQPRHDSCTRS